MFLVFSAVLSCKHRGTETGVPIDDSGGADTSSTADDTGTTADDTGTPADDTGGPPSDALSLAGLALTGPDGSEAGVSVTRLSNLSGDGAEAFAIGSASGTSWLLETAGPGSLDDLASATITGPEGARSVLADPGDVDGDGYGDLLIGGATADGAAWLLHGPLTGSHTLADDGWYGSKDGSGLRVAGPGDLTGDGHPDLLIASPLSDVAGVDAGTIWLLSADAAPGAFPDAAVATLTGDIERSFAGYAMDAAGDFTGDGLPDVVIGAWGSDTYAGTAYVQSGPLSGTGSLSDADLRLTGAVTWDVAGWSVAGTGDLSGDGQDDVVVGAYGVDTGSYSVGTVYLLSGGMTGDLSLSQSPGRIIGVGEGDNAGWSVAGAGDVDADGHADLLIGGTGVDAGVNQGGGAWVIYGPITGTHLLSEADLTILGETTNSNTGFDLDAGDLNGDGRVDFIIGAPDADSAYVLLMD